MGLPHLTAMRVIAAAAVPLTAVALWTPATNAFEPGKLFVLIMVATGLVAGLAVHVVQSGVLPRLPRPVVVTAGLLATALVIATATSSDVLLSLVGVRTRYGGLLVYLAVLAIILITAMVADAQTARWTLHGVCVASGVVVLIGLLQAVGLDLIQRGSEIGVTSTFGNSNYAAAWTGAAMAAVAWLGVSAGGWGARRWIAVALGVASLAFIAASRSLQGFPTALAAVAPAIVVASASLGSTARRLARGGLVAATVLGAATIVAGVLGRGPASALGDQISVQLRGHYWDAAVRMGLDSPLTGVGLDNYGSAYRLVRTAEAAQATDLLTGNNAAHNVPLHLLAGGGFPLLIAYLAFVGATGFFLLRGLARLEGASRLLLAGVAGMWLGYQVQSMVSIDIPVLMTLHAVTAGLGIGLAVQQAEGLRLPWAPPQVTGPKGRRGPAKRRAGTRRPPPVSSGRRQLGSGVAALISLIGLLVAVQPARADSALYRALQAEAAQDGPRQIAEAERAADIGFWDPAYAHRAGSAHQNTGDIDAAEEWYRIVDQRGFGQFDSALSAARGFSLAGLDRAMPWFDRVLELEPQHPDLLLQVAAFFADNGRADDALALAERVLAADPGNDEAAELRLELTDAAERP